MIKSLIDYKENDLVIQPLVGLQFMTIRIGIVW